MLFAEFPLYRAVLKVYQSVDDGGSDEWLHKELPLAYKLVLSQLVDDKAWSEQGILWSIDRVRDAWMQLRKNKNLRLTCEVAAIRGAQCFFFRRGLGDCSDEIDLDRICPGSRDGPYQQENCFITCSFHNRSRGNRTIEAYLATASASTSPLFGEVS